MYYDSTSQQISSSVTEIVVFILWSDLWIVRVSGLNMATSPLQQKANEVRANRVNWQSYLQYVWCL